jgi:hypothetical protein
MSVRVLPDFLVNQIAAGEVVEACHDVAADVLSIHDIAAGQTEDLNLLAGNDITRGDNHDAHPFVKK